MNKKEVLNRTEDFVRRTLRGAEGGHDWFHIQRVRNNARRIALGEDVDGFIVELAALLHDIADSKFHGGNEKIGPTLARKHLENQGVRERTIAHVVAIVNNISFKGGNFLAEFDSPELKVVQDADRLDALGAIGIARAFNYGGHKGRLLYDPSIKPQLNMTKEQYKSSTAPTINHFYEKLLLLKGRMNTATGRKIAEERHQFMELFLEHFYREWEGIDN